MRGLMMDRPLLIQSLIRYAARYHAETEIVSRTTEGPLHRYTYADAEPRTKQLANALMRLGVGLGDRVATIAWNNHRHFEAYYAISGVGAICHTINPRLFADQLAYIVNHAQDKVLLLDLTFVPLAEKMAASWPAIRHYVVMTDRAHMPATSLPNALCYEDIVAAETPGSSGRSLTRIPPQPSATPRGRPAIPRVHSTAIVRRSSIPMRFARRTMSVSGCTTCCARSCRCSMSMPGVSRTPQRWPARSSSFPVPARRCQPAGALRGGGRDLRPRRADGVARLLQHLEASGKRIDSVKRVTCGGAAVPISMIRAFAERYGVTLIHGWGMTEMSPVGSLCEPEAELDGRGSGGRVRDPRPPGQTALRRRVQDRRPRRQAPPRGWGRKRRVAGPRTLGRRCLLRGRSRQPRRRSTPRAGSAPATSRRSTPKGACRSSTAART